MRYALTDARISTLAVQRHMARLERVTEVTDGPVIKGVFDEHRVSITADGRTWIRKRVVITGDQPLVAEAISWLIARELELPVPHAAILVAPDHNDTSWLSQEISPMLQWDDRDAAAVLNIDALGGVIALDTLTLNNDRHQGNLLVQSVGPRHLHLWAIDSGNALVGWVGDFLERQDETPDPAVLPVRRIVNTLIWQRIVASAAEGGARDREHPRREHPQVRRGGMPVRHGAQWADDHRGLPPSSSTYCRLHRSLPGRSRKESMMTSTFQLVHYVPNLFVGGRLPVAAMVLGADTTARLVRALHLPDERCLGGRDHVAALAFALARLERDPGTASTAVLGPHLQFDPPRQVPGGVEPDRWLREQVLPRPPASLGTRGTRRATYGYAWLQAAGIARFVKKKFRPDKADVLEISALVGKGLKPISHWVSDGVRLLLLEPVIPQDLSGPVEDIATTLGAYRFHLASESRVTLGVYMLAGGSPSARIHAQRSLQSTAHRVFDTEAELDRNAFISEVRLVGERHASPLLH